MMTLEYLKEQVGKFPEEFKSLAEDLIQERIQKFELEKQLSLTLSEIDSLNVKADALRTKIMEHEMKASQTIGAVKILIKLS